MRSTETRLRCRATVSVVAVALTAGVLLGTPTAHADRPDRPELPSRAEVQQARDDAQEAAVRVAEIQAELVSANAELEAAAIRAEQAFEAYNGARWAAEQAEEELRQAVHAAR